MQTFMTLCIINEFSMRLFLMQQVHKVEGSHASYAQVGGAVLFYEFYSQAI